MRAQRLVLDSPEVLLAGLNRSSLELYGVVASRLNSPKAKELEESLRDVLRRTLAIEAISVADFIAIAGAQGAGKTTLLGMLYDLPSAILSPNAGVGEKVPLLVVEDSGVAVPTRLVRRLSGDSDRPIIVDAVPGDQEWADALRGADDSAMLLVLRVPVRYFGGAERGFVLLPGYETLARENRVRQTLMREALRSAQGAIVVTDRTRLADDKNAKILADLAGHVSEPVVVVAKSESLDTETRAETARVAAARFDVSEENVVFTSVDLDDRDEWLPRLQSRLEALTAKDSTRLNQLNALADALDALADVEQGIADQLDAQQLKAEVTPGPWDGLIAAYDQEARKAVAAYEKALAAPLNEHREAARSRAMEHSKRNEGGLWNPVKNFFTSEYNLDERRRTGMRDAWSAGQVNAVIAQAARSAAGERVSVVVSGRRAAPGRPSAAGQLPSSQAAEGRPGPGDPVGSELVLQEGLMRELLVLAGATIDTRPDEILAAARVLPALALEVAGLGMQGSLSGIGLALAAGQEPDERGVASQLLDAVGEHRAAMFALAGFLGADIAMDGDFDGPVATAAAIKAGLVGAGLSSAAAAVALVVVGAAAGALIAVNEVNRADRARIREIDLTLTAYRDETLAISISSVRDLLDLGRERLVARGRELHRLDDAHVDRIWASKVLADVREQRIRLEREVRANPLMVLGS